MSTRIARTLALLIGMPAAALVISVVGASVPDRAVMSELHDAIRAGEITAASYRVGVTGGRIDGFSECKRLTIGLGSTTSNPIETAVRSPTLGPCEIAVPKIEGWAAGDGVVRSYEYFRYWNGSAAVLRPSVAVVGVAGTRILAFVVVAAATIALWWSCRRRAGTLGACMLLAPILVTTDWIDLPGALVHAIGMATATGAAAALCWLLRPDDSIARFAAAAFVAGGAFLYLADLTNPDAAWALTACAAALVVIGVDRRAAAVRVGAVGVAWIAGFAWMWLAKWVVAALVVGVDLVRASVTGQIELRLGRGDEGAVAGGRFAGLRQAWSEWWNEPLTALAVIVLLLVAVAVSWRRRDLAATWQWRLLVALPALIPIGWHTIMRNHSQLHGWFTYRSFAVAFGILLLALTARPASNGHAGDDVPERRPASVTEGV